ncbi:MAG TPA: spermidine synthase [Myxococcota bacterium]|nr:spermidine synthase [Myxococcota bacterium]
MERIPGRAALSRDAAPDYLAAEESPLGLVCLRERALAGAPGAVATEITLDHQFLMSSANTASERALAERAITMHAGDRLAVLVGGLGLGYTAHAVLASPRVARVEVVEYLAPVIGWLRRGWLPLSDALARDARLSVVQGDVYAQLAGEPTGERWDVILIDVDHSPEEPLGSESAAFYCESGLACARRHLAPGGVLGVWSYAESPRFADALARAFAEVSLERVRFENRVVGEEETNVLFLARA